MYENLVKKKIKGRKNDIFFIFFTSSKGNIKILDLKGNLTLKEYIKKNSKDFNNNDKRT